MKIARLPDGTPEIFHTLQGEGVSAGTPAVFIRASLCNLHCVWCDTDYTWNWKDTPWKHERDDEEGYEKFDPRDTQVAMTPVDVAAAAEQFNCRHLVVTGGEPLVQQEEFTDVIEILRERNPAWTVEIETNGTERPEDHLDELVGQYNVSPKLANSGNAESLRLKPEVLTFFADSPKAWFKFVVSSAGDLAEIAALQERFGLDSRKILLMPEGRDRETLQKRRKWVAETCLNHGYRYSDRIHLELWEGQRSR